MTTELANTARGGSRGITGIVLVSLLALALLAGWHFVTRWAATWVAVLLFPPAFGLPFLWPPLSFVPNGSVPVWLIDLAGFVAMMVTAFVLLTAAQCKRAVTSRGRAFGRAMWITLIAMIIGNIVRIVGYSFLVEADLATYLVQLGATILVTALTGLVPALLIGILAATTHRQGAAEPVAA